MLETPEERVKLLKAGIPVKTIEMLYIKYNNFKIVRRPVLFEINIKKDNSISRDASAEYWERLFEDQWKRLTEHREFMRGFVDGVLAIWPSIKERIE